MYVIENIINAQTRNRLSEEELAEIIRSLRFLPEYCVQVYNFFTDVPLRAVGEFLERHDIPLERLKTYYEAHVRSAYPNPELEEIFA